MTAKDGAGAAGTAPRIRRAVLLMIVARWGAAISGLIALAVLARILPQEAFGLYAGLLALVLFLEVLADFGISARLVQRASLTQAERSAGEGLSLALGLASATGLALGAWLLPEGLLPSEGPQVLALLAPAALLGAVSRPLEAVLSRDLSFGVIASLGMARAATEALVAILLALAGAGAAALAGGLLAHRLVQTVVLLAAARRAPWRPRLRGTGAFWRYGGPFTVMGALPKGGDVLVLQSVGALLGLGALGLLDRARQVTNLLDKTVLEGIMPVVLPALSRSLDAGATPRSAYAVKVEILTALLWPAFALIALLADPLVLVLLGPDWQGAVGPIRVLALGGLTAPVTKMGMKVFVALDMVPAYARIQAAQQVARVAFVALGAAHSLEAACLGIVAASILKAVLIERALAQRIGTRWRHFGGTARDGMVLCIASLAGPAALIAWTPLSGAALLAASLPLAGAGWLAACLLLRHRLLREMLAVLPLRRPAA